MCFSEVFRGIFTKGFLVDSVVIFVSLNAIFFYFRFLKRILCGRYSYFSNHFEDIFEKINDIKHKKSFSNTNKSLYYDIEKGKIFDYYIEEIDDSYNINLSKGKSGEQADLYINSNERS
ncbi:MAG: hypothetical protein K2J39_05110 [Ruminococcus sp.]|nr:hypothetical protein [Ruminococcus sp.]